MIQHGLPFQYPKLLNNLSSQVAIIGGGISGALTAFYLTEAGIDCILLDGRTIGLGSSCASTSLLQYELDEPLSNLIAQVGEQTAVRAYQLCSHAIDILIDIMNRLGFTDYEERKSLFFTSHAGQLSFLKKNFLNEGKQDLKYLFCQRRIFIPTTA